MQKHVFQSTFARRTGVTGSLTPTDQGSLGTSRSGQKLKTSVNARGEIRSHAASQCIATQVKGVTLVWLVASFGDAR